MIGSYYLVCPGFSGSGPKEFGFLNSGGFELGLESGESLGEVVDLLCSIGFSKCFRVFFYHPARPASG